jgi:hypothetical protein
MPEVIHGYTIGPLDRYCFFRDYLIVVSPSRQHAVAVAPDGEMVALPMWHTGELRADASAHVDTTLSE